MLGKVYSFEQGIPIAMSLREIWKCGVICDYSVVTGRSAGRQRPWNIKPGCVDIHRVSSLHTDQ